MSRIHDFATSRVTSFVSSSGNREHVLYESRFDGQQIKLTEVGREDIRQKIRAFAPFTDMNYMLSRLRIGDTAVLNPRPPMYGDFTGLPTTVTDAVNMVQNAESRFDMLDPKDKLKYNNDFRLWLADILSTSISGSESNDDGSSSGAIDKVDPDPIPVPSNPNNTEVM